MIAKLIPTRIHGMLDYLFGLMYIALPLLLNWPQPAAAMLMALGAGVIVYSLLTRYELGVFKLLPMPGHLVIDLLGGLFLMLAPTFGLVDESVRNWFWMLGAIELVITLLSDTRPRLVETAGSAYHSRIAMPARMPATSNAAGSTPTGRGSK